jgi:hypothetical protein
MLSTVQQSVLAYLVSHGFAFSVAQSAVVDETASHISFDQLLRNALASLGVGREAA